MQAPLVVRRDARRQTVAHAGRRLRARAWRDRKRDRRIGPQEEQTLLTACSTMNAGEHKCVGPAMHDRLIGALETCCRQGEMLRAEPGRRLGAAADRRPRREREGLGEPAHPVRPARAAGSDSEATVNLGPLRVRFGSSKGGFQDSFKTAWESLLLLAHGHDTTRAKPGARVDREKLGQDRPALARPASRGRLPAPGRRRRSSDDPIDAWALRHQDDPALSEHHGRRSSEGPDWCAGTAAAVEGSRRITRLETTACHSELSVICQSTQRSATD